MKSNALTNIFWLLLRSGTVLKHSYSHPRVIPKKCQYLLLLLLYNRMYMWKSSVAQVVPWKTTASFQQNFSDQQNVLVLYMLFTVCGQKECSWVHCVRQYIRTMWLCTLRKEDIWHQMSDEVDFYAIYSFGKMQKFHLKNVLALYVNSRDACWQFVTCFSPPNYYFHSLKRPLNLQKSLQSMWGTGCLRSLSREDRD